MAVHSLGLLASLLLGAWLHAPDASRSRPALLFLLSLSLLVAAMHAAYASFALLIATLAAAACWWRPHSLAIRLALYALSCWFLPIVSTWGVCMDFGEELFSQEVGHLFQTTFEFGALVVVPLVVSRVVPGDRVRLQRVESLTLLAAGLAGGSIESTAIWLRDRDKGDWSPANDYQHILHAFTWGTFGLLGLVAARHGHLTDLHVGGAAMVFGAGMLMHTDAGHSPDKFMLAWAQMHVVSAALFIVGGVLRMMGKVTDAVCAFFVGALYFTLSARQVSYAIAAHFPSSMAAVLAVFPLSVTVLAAHLHVLHCVIDDWKRHALPSLCERGNLEKPSLRNVRAGLDTRPIFLTEDEAMVPNEEV
eukprot:scaffold288626_cov27-Tisochrysis_lutea.AAC.1